MFSFLLVIASIAKQSFTLCKRLLRQPIGFLAMTNNAPAIILTRPQMGENIGAAARGMLNFSLHEMRIVAPRDGWPNQAAIDMSAGAFDALAPPQIFETLPDSLADCHHVYATTARRRDMVKPVMDLEAATIDAHKRQAEGQKIAFVFGPERTGLENDDLAHCHSLIHIPTNPDFSSINLGQSILLLAYAWHSNGLKNSAIAPNANDSRPATQDKMEEFFKRLENELDEARFFRDAGLKPTMVRNIRSMLLRAALTDQEVRTFHGIISALIGKKTNSQ